MKRAAACAAALVSLASAALAVESWQRAFIVDSQWKLYRGAHGYGQVAPDAPGYLFHFSKNGTAWMYTGPAGREKPWRGQVKWSQEGSEISISYQDSEGRTDFYGDISPDGSYMSGKVSFLDARADFSQPLPEEEHWQAWRQ